MCLIVVQPIGDKAFSSRDIEDAWNTNPHGAGYMFCTNDNQLIVRKPFFKMRSFKKWYYREFEQYGHISPFVLHFRTATHGLRDATNTHPHVINDTCAVVHNGILQITDPDGKLSDTASFVKYWLQYETTDEIMSPDFQKDVEGFVGQVNKLVFMDNEKNICIVHKEQGEEEPDGRWYSNIYWRYCSKPKWNTSVSYVPAKYRVEAKWRNEMEALFGDEITRDEWEDWRSTCGFSRS